MKMTEVAPIEPSVAEITEDIQAPEFNSAQPTIKDDFLEGSSPNGENFNGDLLQALEEIYSPVLKMMKMLGMYFGDSTLSRLQPAYVPCRKNICISRFYCGVVGVGLWFNFAIPVVSVLFGGDIFMLVIFISWCLLVALNLTTLLIVLPLTDTRKSRFEKFLRKAIAIHNGSFNLEKVKNKARVCLMVFSLLFVVSTVNNIINDVMMDLNTGIDKPWNVWTGFRILSLLFDIYGCAVWLLSFPFFCITCLILESLFDDFLKRMSTLNSNSMCAQVVAVSSEHHKLCEVVELADSMLSPLLIQVVTFYIPVICFNFYQVANLPDLPAEGKLNVLITTLFWLLISSAILAVIMVLGSRVNEKIHCIQKDLKTLPIAAEDEGKFLLFVLDLQGEPKGLSIGGLAVITKSLSLTVVGVIVSYLAVMLSLPK